MRKKIAIILSVCTVVLLFMNCSNGEDEAVKGSIVFQKITFQKAIEKAKLEHKIVFIDAYATWCGPCKQLSKKTFTDKKVGDLFNAQFINVKIDVDEAEGKQFAEKFEINSIPTLLFFDQEGKLMHRIQGFYTPSELLTEAKKVVGK
jgi:thiol:disulfide interchange protein